MNYSACKGRRSSFTGAFVLLLLSMATGCTTVLTPITGTPVLQVPDELLGVRRSEFIPVPVVMLKAPVPDQYTLSEGDILGVYIDGVLPASLPNSVPVAPPVNFPEPGSGLPPSIGFPIPVQENGIVNLPLLRPFRVEGMTIDQVRDEIEKQYREEDILINTSTVPIVSLMKQRDYTVTVIRANASSENGTDGTAAGYTLELPAGRNDVLNALTESGGLPGFNERNEVVIYKTSRISEDQRAAVMAQLLGQGGACCGNHANLPFPVHSPDGFAFDDSLIENEMVVRIPLRYPPGCPPVIRPSDITLNTGDIVMVESRETEFFYTGGLLPGSQIPLPRDYDLDVLGAMALAGQGLASQQGGGGGGGGLGGGMGQGFGGPSPTQLYIIRKLPCGRTFNIVVDIQLAMNNSSQNILVQPGDTLILRYKPHEELVNFAIPTFFTFGIRELFSD